MMRNKNLLFSICSTALLIAFNASAVDVLRPEDESILWEVHTDEGKTVHGVIDQVVSGGGREEIVYVEPLKPMKGPGLMSIPVPEEINQKARAYEDTSADSSVKYLSINSSAPRSVAYPIGAERREADAWRRRGFQPHFHHETVSMSAHRRLIDDYKAKAADCLGSKKDQLDIEMSMLDGRELYRNAAYLSETFDDIMHCYDDLGLDIIDVFYYGDNEVLRKYNQTTPQFEVKIGAPNFDTKYCHDGFCSMASVAELQLEKFADFERYLHQLLDEAPNTLPFRAANSDMPDIDEAETIEQRQRPINIIRRGEPMPVQNNGRVVRAEELPVIEDGDVPYIDEADF